MPRKNTRTTRLEDGISITGGGAPGQTQQIIRLEDGTSVTRGEAPGPTRHKIRLEDGISITGGEAPGQTHNPPSGRRYVSTLLSYTKNDEEKNQISQF